MKPRQVLRSYRKGLKRMAVPSLEALERAKQVNLKMLKVCFGPCRCFSAAKR